MSGEDRHPPGILPLEGSVSKGNPALSSISFPHIDGMGSMDRLLEVMHILRQRCPWVGAQSPLALTRYAVEEAYEVEEAVRRGDVDDIRDELGDLLFQVVFQSEMFSERREDAPRSEGGISGGGFTFNDVADSMAAKLIRRNPQLFNSKPRSDGTAEEASVVWQRVKREEAKLKADREIRSAQRGSGVADAKSLMDDVKHGPALCVAEGTLEVLERVGIPQTSSSSAGVVRSSRAHTRDAIARLEADLATLKASVAEADGEGDGDALRDPAHAAGFSAMLGNALLSLVAVGRTLPLRTQPSPSSPSTSSSAIEEALLLAVGAQKDRFRAMEKMARIADPSRNGVAGMDTKTLNTLWGEAADSTFV